MSKNQSHVESFEALKMTRLFRANNQTDKLNGAEVDFNNGAIYGVSMCTVGEALGHGVWLEQSFIEDIVKFGNRTKVGLKARFGHPNMSGEALGTFIGRFHNFRIEGSKAIADLYLSDVAKKSPNGDLFTYVLDIASKEPDAFGASIVFSAKELYFYNEDGDRETVVFGDYGIENKNYTGQKIYVQMQSLNGTDLVDEPAANPDGLFSQLSSTSLHADKFAVIATEFLNKHPQIAEFVKSNPHKISEFMNKFNTNGTAEMPVDVIEDGTPKTGVDASSNTQSTVREDSNGEGVASPDSTATENDLYSRIESRFAARFAAYEDRITALESRIRDLEDNPTADPTFSKRQKDAEPVVEKPVYSWDKEAAKRKGK